MLKALASTLHIQHTTYQGEICTKSTVAICNLQHSTLFAYTISNRWTQGLAVYLPPCLLMTLRNVLITLGRNKKKCKSSAHQSNYVKSQGLKTASWGVGKKKAGMGNTYDFWRQCQTLPNPSVACCHGNALRENWRVAHDLHMNILAVFVGLM